MPQTSIFYEDVEVIDADGLGFTCRVGNDRFFIGRYVPLDGTTIRSAGDRGRLALPRWFVEQQGLPLSRRMDDREVEEWHARAALRLATAKERAERTPGDAEAQAALDQPAPSWPPRWPRARGASANLDDEGVVLFRQGPRARPTKVERRSRRDLTGGGVRG